MQERSSLENAVSSIWRRKGGLETPLEGRFWGERRRLSFAPPRWYDALVFVCLVGAPIVGMMVRMGMHVPGGPVVATWTSIAVFLAGMWAAFSNERMLCDLRTGTYMRLEGSTIFKRLVRGSLKEIDALVLLTEEWPTIGGRLVIYRLVLYWKGSKEPLLVVERENHSIPMGAPLNTAAGPMLHKGAAYAQAMGVTFYDNSYYSSPAPVPVV